MELTNLKENQEFMEWILVREKISGDTQDEEVLKNLWIKYQKELEYDKVLGF